MLTNLKIWFLASCLLSACYTAPPAPPFPVLPDLENGKKVALQSGQPILILFDWTGSSVDAVELLRQPEIGEIISKNYVFVQVFADNPRKWPDGTVFTDRNGHQINHIGGYYRDLQYRFFKEEFQPMYAILDAAGQPVLKNNKPFYEGYLSAEEARNAHYFKDFLARGLAAVAKK